MKKQLTAIALTLLITLSSGITTLAAPELVNADGVWITFDSEYYAANNPDVAAAVGTDANALLQHYLSAGQYEGRLCCAPMTQVGTAKLLSGYLYYSYDIVIPIMPGERLVKIISHKADGTISSSRDIIYDSKGNLVQIGTGNYPDKYEYDDHGNLILDSRLGLSYDGQGNRTKTQVYSGGPIIYEDNIYDSDGKLLEHIQHEGEDGKTTYRLKYSYDEEGKLVSLVGAYDRREPDLTETRRYNDMGKMIERAQGIALEALPFPGFDKEAQVSQRHVYAYDESGRLIKLNHTTYEYDSRGNVAKMIFGVEGWNAGDWEEFIYE